MQIQSNDLRELNLIEIEAVSGGLTDRARMLPGPTQLAIADGAQKSSSSGSSGGSSTGTSGGSGSSYKCFDSGNGTGMQLCT